MSQDEKKKLGDMGEELDDEALEQVAGGLPENYAREKMNEYFKENTPLNLRIDDPNKRRRFA